MQFHQSILFVISYPSLSIMIILDVPDIKSREEIFLVHLKPLTLDKTTLKPEDYAKRLAALTPGFSGT